MYIGYFRSSKLLLQYFTFYAIFTFPEGETFPHGASTGSCRSLYPGHFYPKQKTESPYSLRVEPKVIEPGGSVLVQIESQEKPLKGFLLQAQDSNGSAVGTFRPPEDRIAKTLSCGDKQNNSLTHTGIYTGINKFIGLYNVTAEWIAPNEELFHVRFHAAFVQSFSVFWTPVKSNVFTIRSSQATVTLLENTTTISLISSATVSSVSNNSESTLIKHTSTTLVPPRTTVTTWGTNFTDVTIISNVSKSDKLSSTNNSAFSSTAATPTNITAQNKTTIKTFFDASISTETTKAPKIETLDALFSTLLKMSSRHRQLSKFNETQLTTTSIYNSSSSINITTIPFTTVTTSEEPKLEKKSNVSKPTTTKTGTNYMTTSETSDPSEGKTQLGAKFEIFTDIEDKYKDISTSYSNITVKKSSNMDTVHSTSTTSKHNTIAQHNATAQQDVTAQYSTAAQHNVTAQHNTRRQHNTMSQRLLTNVSGIPTEPTLVGNQTATFKGSQVTTSTSQEKNKINGTSAFLSTTSSKPSFTITRNRFALPMPTHNPYPTPTLPQTANHPMQTASPSIKRLFDKQMFDIQLLQLRQFQLEHRLLSRRLEALLQREEDLKEESKERSHHRKRHRKHYMQILRQYRKMLRDRNKHKAPSFHDSKSSGNEIGEYGYQSSNKGSSKEGNQGLPGQTVHAIEKESSQEMGGLSPQTSLGIGLGIGIPVFIAVVVFTYCIVTKTRWDAQLPAQDINDPRGAKGMTRRRRQRIKGTYI